MKREAKRRSGLKSTPNIDMKFGNIPDEAVRRSMQIWGERFVPRVHNL